MRIPVDADVVCNDGFWGHSTCLIVNPISRDVTHFVVRESNVVDNECLVPIDLIAEAAIHTITLYCSKEELANLPAFISSHFVEKPIAQYDLSGNNQAYLTWPLVTYATQEKAEEHIPLGELTIHKGATIVAIDGTVGEVNEFVVEENGKHITHIILDANHLLANQHVVIPVADIRRIEKDHVYLRFTKEEVKHLPHYIHAIY